MIQYNTATRSYAHIWNKYRPAILKLMMDATDGPQTYKLSDHEFKGINPKEKGGHSFVLKVHQGKSLSNIKSHLVAQDLLLVLKSSKTALRLVEDSTFTFKVDKQCVLHIEQEKHETPTEETTESEAV